MEPILNHYRAAATNGGLIGIALLVALGAVLAGLGWAQSVAGPGPSGVLLALPFAAAFVATAWIAFWTWGFYSLRYGLSRDGVAIRWAASRHIIPMHDITHVLSGRRYAGPLRGLRWPGYEIGRTTVIDDEGDSRDVLVYATVAPEEQLLVVTPDITYAISPDDVGAFVEDFKRRRKLGVMESLEQRTVHAPLADLSIWGDRVALALAGAALAINALALAWLAWHYPGLPQEFALRFSFDPVISQPVPGPANARAVAWRLPLIGLAALVADSGIAAWLHGRAPLAARLIVCGALLVQVALVILLLRVI